MWQTALITFLAIQAMMTGAWIISYFIRNVAVIDSFWGLGFVLVAWTALFINGAPVANSAIIVCLISVWGLRLSAYLTWRNWGQEEDARYAAMRKNVGSRFKWTSYITVFTLQAILLWLISMPIQLASLAETAEGPAWVIWLGCIIWLGGFYFEVVGDWQLARFKSKPENKGQVLDQGLWKYTRHPNYFGEFCMCWGIYLISINAGGIWTFFSPVIMTFLLMKVSGVTLLERDISERRPAYQRYQKNTSAFFPAPPKN
jgi:steroid 5-alpha reductase family enzyme